MSGDKCTSTPSNVGDREHEWQPVRDGGGRIINYVCCHITPEGRIIDKCDERRTVADFWKDEPPEDIQEGDWFFYLDHGGNITASKYWWLDDETNSTKVSSHHKYWHGPIETRNGRILPPPLPENKTNSEA